MKERDQVVDIFAKPIKIEASQKFRSMVGMIEENVLAIPKVFFWDQFLGLNPESSFLP